MAKVNTCVYIEREILETARELGLNVSRVAENGLVEAIGRLTGAKPETGLNSPARYCISYIEPCF